MIRISWGIQGTTLEPCKYCNRIKRRHFLFAFSETTFGSSYFRCGASQDGSALQIILFSITHFWPASLNWVQISDIEKFKLYMHALPLVMALIVVMIRRWMPIPWSLKGCTLAKSICLLAEMKAFFNFMQNPGHFLEKDPKTSIIP